jgi:hypothetical protein
MVLQVYWYTSLMALTPQPPNADAFAGMALGATIGERCSTLRQGYSLCGLVWFVSWLVYCLVNCSNIQPPAWLWERPSMSGEATGDSFQCYSYLLLAGVLELWRGPPFVVGSGMQQQTVGGMMMALARNNVQMID